MVYFSWTQIWSLVTKLNVNNCHLLLTGVHQCTSATHWTCVLANLLPIQLPWANVGRQTQAEYNKDCPKYILLCYWCDSEQSVATDMLHYHSGKVRISQVVYITVKCGVNTRQMGVYCILSKQTSSSDALSALCVLHAMHPQCSQKWHWLL